MADTKISQLPAATTPTGTEVVPILQGGTNKRTTAAALAAPAVATHEAAADPHPQYLTQAEGDGRYATAAQGTDAREWSAATIDQAEAEAGIATTRRAFTAQRVFQAVAAWWAASAPATKLAGIANGATANATDAQLRDRSTHTGTQAAGTITGLAGVATSGAYGDLSGRPTLGTAAALDTGTTAGKVVALDGTGKLPAVDGSQLTGLSSGTTDLSYDASTREVRSSTGTDATLPLVSTSTAGLAPATSFSTITYAADVELDMAALDGQYRTISLTGNLSLTTINRANGRTVVLRLICDATQRTLTFPAGWVFIGTKPANIAASKTAVLSLTFFGTASTDAVVAYAVQS